MQSFWQYVFYGSKSKITRSQITNNYYRGPWGQIEDMHFRINSNNTWYFNSSRRWMNPAKYTKKNMNQSIAQILYQSQVLTLYQSIPLSAKNSCWAKETCPYTKWWVTVWAAWATHTFVWDSWSSFTVKKSWTHCDSNQLAHFSFNK